MKNSKLFSILISAFISTSIIASSTSSKHGPIAFEDGWGNGKTYIATLDLPARHSSFAKHEQHNFKVVDNPNLDHLNFSNKKWQNKNSNITCLDTVASCNNLNQGINITDGHGNKYYARHFTAEHSSDSSLKSYSSNGGGFGWGYYNLGHDSKDRFDNGHDNGNHYGNENGNGKDHGGDIKPPSELPVVPAPQAVFLTSTGLWVLSWLRRKSF